MPTDKETCDSIDVSKREKLIELLLASRGWTQEYHNQKENVIYLALGLSVAGCGTALNAETDWNGTLLRATIFAALLFNHGFIVDQSRNRRASVFKIKAHDLALIEALNDQIESADCAGRKVSEFKIKSEPFYIRWLGLSNIDHLRLIGNHTVIGLLARHYEALGKPSNDRTAAGPWTRAIPLFASCCAVAAALLSFLYTLYTLACH